MFAAMNSFLTPVAPAVVGGGVYTITAGTRAPVYGASAASPSPPTGYTSHVTASADDANFSVALGFTFYMGGTAYTSCHPGSNSYITFGVGSSAYNSLSSSNPANDKFFFMGADNSWQRVSTIVAATYCRIRYEGTANTSGTPGNPNIVYEATLFNPSSFSNNSVVELLIGSNGRSTGLMSASSATTHYATGTPTPNQSFVFSGNSTGTAWTLLTGYYVAGTNY